MSRALKWRMTLERLTKMPIAERYHPTLSSYYRHVATLGDYLELLAVASSASDWLQERLAAANDGLQRLLRGHLVAWSDGRFDNQLGSASGTRAHTCNAEHYSGLWGDVSTRQQAVSP